MKKPKNKAAAALAKLRWDKTTKEERQAIGEMIRAAKKKSLTLSAQRAYKETDSPEFMVK